jgi:hypothetical protein
MSPSKNGFTAMSTENFSAGPSPYDPYSRAKLGWINPIEVTDSLSDQAITGYMSSDSGQAYELMHSPREYFLVSNHKLSPPFASPWEEGFPGRGLLIWHVDTTGNNLHHVDHKLVDVEAAHGLYDNLGQENESPNDSTGKDSLDLYSLGVPTCFFNDSTKTAFNDTTNPTTDGYVCYDTLYGKWKQTVLTGIAVNNIQGAGGDTMWADLFPSIIYWGPDTVHITGDFVVESASKLHIFPGTVVIFDTTDDQQGGSDESKCELIIEGTLEALGTEDDSIQFLTASSTPSDSNWHGIIVESGGSARFNYCDLRNAYTAIYYGNSAQDSVTHCRFVNNFMHAINTHNDSLLIESCVIENDSIGGSNEIYGILCDGSSPTIKYTLIKNCEYGIKVASGKSSQASPLIEECGFYNIGEVGIWSTGLSDLDIKQSCFKGSFGKACIHVYRGTPEIYRCYMASEGSGIPIGMLFQTGAKGSVRHTTIWDYDSCAVEIVGYSSNPDFGTSDSAGNNWFERTGRYYFVSSSDSTIKAEHNYWGISDSTAIDSMIYGDVDFSPFLIRCYEPVPYYPDICSHLPPYDPTYSPCKIAVNGEEKIPKSFAISQNYPNPFNPQTVIKYDLPKPSHVRLLIYNILGQKVRTVVDEDQGAGRKSVNWDGKDDQGKDVASGIYFYQIKAGEFSMVKKMVLLK